jgi:hypothetical protein
MNAHYENRLIADWLENEDLTRARADLLVVPGFRRADTWNTP